MTNCVSLTEVNIDYIILCDEAMSFLSNNLTTTVEKLSFMRDGPSEVKYEHIKTLLNRCTKLTELNLTNVRHGYNSGLTCDEKEEFRNQFQQLIIYDDHSGMDYSFFSGYFTRLKIFKTAFFFGDI